MLGLYPLLPRLDYEVLGINPGLPYAIWAGSLLTGSHTQPMASACLPLVFVSYSTRVVQNPILPRNRSTENSRDPIPGDKLERDEAVI